MVYGLWIMEHGMGDRTGTGMEPPAGKGGCPVYAGWMSYFGGYIGDCRKITSAVIWTGIDRENLEGGQK